MNLSLRLFSFIILLSILFSCKDDNPKLIWHRTFEGLGSSSSPLCVDLNLDGISDCVIGAGLNEFDHSDSSVIAIDGKNGKVLWAVPGKDQMVGSPVFIKINYDDIPDIVIGGRGAQLYAINGFNGQILWQYEIKENDLTTIGYMRVNFYTPQLIPDQNFDNIQELLVTNGGNFAADPVSGDDRYPGVLAVLDGSNGEILAAATVPDNAETYMSPVTIIDENPLETSIIYGSGGETFGGHLYEVKLSDLMKNDISGSRVLLSKLHHGFIAPPTLTDISSDGIVDIIVNWHGGEMIAIDRSKYKTLWTVSVPKTEVYASPTPGKVNDDNVPDFFSQFSLGKWPNYTGAYQIIVDGNTGELLRKDSLGCGSFSTALSADTNNDGYSEFIYTINDYDCDNIYLGNTEFSLKQLDYVNNEIKDIISPIFAKNIFTTPMLGDMDNNGKKDLVVGLQSNYNDELSYYGIHYYRLEFSSTSISDKVKKWNQYLGPHSNGNY